jgi:hypothetical protein
MDGTACRGRVNLASQDPNGLVDWTAFSQARTELGANFVRILGYFHEDGVKSVAQIEEAMRSNNAAALVLPAHTLKGEPSEALPHVVELRPLFEATLALLEREANPLVERRPAAAFGRRPTL